jgi:aryl-alcohol dehydrogenase-like predicted oxidoreductase
MRDLASVQNRRRFLSASAAGSLCAGWQPWHDLATAQEASRTTASNDQAVEYRNRQGGMKYRRLGRTGFMVSEIVLGGNEITPDNYELALKALDRGVNYLDTSPAYGRGKSELGLGKVIKARPRDQFFLTSKVSVWDVNRNQAFQQIFDGLPGEEQTRLRDVMRLEIERRGTARDEYLVNYFGNQRNELEAATLSNLMEKKYGDQIDRPKAYRQSVIKSVDESLARLGTDHLDILMCPHGASSPEELAHPEIFEAFEVLRKAGKVRHLGVSSHSDPAGVLKAAVDSGHYSAAMVAYNISNAEFMNERIAEAKSLDLGVIAMKVARPVNPGSGRSGGDPELIAKLKSAVDGSWSIPQKAYLWGLGNEDLSAVISNMTDDQQLEENLQLPAARDRIH